MNKLFCHAPWTNIEIIPTGEILPCCKFQAVQYADKFNVRTHTVEQYRNSDFLKQIQHQFQQNEWPQGCVRCQAEENIGVKSKRQLDNDRWQHKYDNYDLASGELLTVGLALGNVCNLKCIMCGPNASSLWQKEYQDIYGIRVQGVGSTLRDLIPSITDIAPNLIHIDLHGGEPFLSNIDQHIALLEHYIKCEQSGEISIHYTTNGTLWPSEEFTSRWRYFKNIDLQISIDGVGSQFEYIRYPANWQQVETNVRKYQELQSVSSNFQLSIAHTVSAFNIYYLDKFFTWCYNMKLPDPWTGKLHRPQQLAPNVWPESARKNIANQLNNSKYLQVRTWAKALDTDGSENFAEFQQFVKRHDAYRKLDFNSVFPELAQYL